MTRKRRRLTFVLTGLILLSAAAALVLVAIRDTVVFFFSPTELQTQPIASDQHIRIGGLIEEGSLSRSADGRAQFRVTDLKTTIPVVFTGLLPDLIREGQGVVAGGRFVDDIFRADEVLAKHDETYMPKEVAAALKASGKWKGDDKQ